MTVCLFFAEIILGVYWLRIPAEICHHSAWAGTAQQGSQQGAAWRAAVLLWGMAVKKMFTANMLYCPVHSSPSGMYTELQEVNQSFVCVCVCVQLAPDQGMVPADRPTELRRRCEEEAQQMVQLKDASQSVANPSFTQLISRLTALLLQIKVCVTGVC